MFRFGRSTQFAIADEHLFWESGDTPDWVPATLPADPVRSRAELVQDVEPTPVLDLSPPLDIESEWPNAYGAGSATLSEPEWAPASGSAVRLPGRPRPNAGARRLLPPLVVAGAVLVVGFLVLSQGHRAVPVTLVAAAPSGAPRSGARPQILGALGGQTAVSAPTPGSSTARPGPVDLRSVRGAGRGRHRRSAPPAARQRTAARAAAAPSPSDAPVRTSPVYGATPAAARRPAPAASAAASDGGSATSGAGGGEFGFER
jgi:hypothetical protein